ncbi:At1g47710 [Linum grandiflorum]
MDLRELIGSQPDVASIYSKHLLLTEAKSSNTVLSPLSIHVILSLIAAGSKGPAQAQLLSFLKAKSGDHLNAFSSELISVLFADGTAAGGPTLSWVSGITMPTKLRMPLRRITNFMPPTTASSSPAAVK